jgi:cytochrome c peroxidase
VATADKIEDANVIYEISPRWNTSLTDRDRDLQFGGLAKRAPVIANDLDLRLDRNTAECAAIPSDPSEAEHLIDDALTYFDSHRISWTASYFQPGKLIANYRYLDATTLENGWRCGQAADAIAGMGIAIQFHLWGAGIRGLFVVNQATGSFVLARGGIGVGYGPILAERVMTAGQPFPTALAGVSVRVTDSRGVPRMAQLEFVSAGWGSINFIVPPESALGPARVSILRADGSSVTALAIIEDIAPGIWTATGDGRGPAMGWIDRRTRDGKTESTPIYKCAGYECEALPIPIARGAATTVRLRGMGMRYAGSAPDLRVTIGGVAIPLALVRATSEPGVDEMILQLKASSQGESDLVFHLNGRLSNVVRINVGGAPKWADNSVAAVKAELGRFLFYDRRISVNGTESCATCHRQELAFTDGKAAAIGATGQTHSRSAMSLVNVAYSATLTWSNPNLTSLEEQALTPMFSKTPVELGTSPEFTEVLRADARYRTMFADAFPAEPDAFTIANVAKALASFERTIASARSPYDRYHGGETDAISDSAKRGEVLFFDPIVGCSKCHGGIAFGGAAEFHDTGLYNLPGPLSYPEPNSGLYSHTHRLSDVGKFKAPTLRNIALTAPYMHDGSIATLEGVLDHYAAGGRTISDGPFAGVGHDNPNKDKSVGEFSLSQRNREDLIAFLRSLTDEEVIHDPRFSDPWTSN